jgi:hypothetical protein
MGFAALYPSYAILRGHVGWVELRETHRRPQIVYVSRQIETV